MPSAQARIFNLLIKIFVRRRSWGRDANAVARRARRVFGSPKIYQLLKSHDFEIEAVNERDIRGEWISRSGAATDKVIFYIHGGGYVASSAATYRPVTTALACLSGLRVFGLDYRLAPEHPFPCALDDAIAAYRRLLAQGIAADKIAVAGDSAGGGLTLAALVRARKENLPLPACAVIFSPWTDMTGSGASVRANDGRCAMFRPANIAEFAAACLGKVSKTDPRASPVLATLDDLPPVLLQVGSTELLLDDARRVHEKIQAAGGASRLTIYEDVPHGWQMLDGLVPEARTALREAADFICQNVSGAMENTCP